MMTEASEIYKKIAEKYNIPIEQVREAVIFFWRSGVKRSLENMTSYEIYIPKLGSFKMKDWKLKYVISKTLELSQRDGMHERNIEYYKLLNSKIIEVQKLIEERDNRYNEFLKQHPEYIPKQASNMGGATEQTL